MRSRRRRMVCMGNGDDNQLLLPPEMRVWICALICDRIFYRIGMTIPL